MNRFIQYLRYEQKVSFSLLQDRSRCYIARYTDVWNRHRESEIHDIHEIGSGTKFYYLWVKGYSTWGERKTHNLSMLTTFTSAPNHVRHPISKLLVWSRRAPKVNLVVRTQELNSLLFSNPPNPQRFRAWRHLPPPVTFFYLGIFNFDICEWHIIPARAWTPALMLHLTNPRTKWKVLILTKPKDKIY